MNQDRRDAAPGQPEQEDRMNGGAGDGMIDEQPSRQAQQTPDSQDSRAQEQAQDRAETAAEDLSRQFEAERERAEEYLEQARRARAELVNYRRRTEQEMEQARRNAGERIIARILPVADDFDRALGAVPESEMNNPWIQGMLLIERKLWSILESEGVKPIEAVGQPFNPAMHEAVSMESGGGDQVVEEYQRGYTLHDRVIRPAMVKVGQGKRNGQEANPSQNSEPAS